MTLNLKRLTLDLITGTSQLNAPGELPDVRAGQHWYKETPVQTRLYREYWISRYGMNGTLVTGFRQYHTSYNFVSEQALSIEDNATCAFRTGDWMQKAYLKTLYLNHPFRFQANPGASSAYLNASLNLRPLGHRVSFLSSRPLKHPRVRAP